MISIRHRFHKRGSLNYVYRKGKVARSEYMSLRFAPNRRDDYRLAVVVSRKVSKSAVTRNRIRRRIYEIVRLHKKEVDKAWPQDMIITVFDDRAATVDYDELATKVKQLLDKASA